MLYHLVLAVLMAGAPPNSGPHPEPMRLYNQLLKEVGRTRTPQEREAALMESKAKAALYAAKVLPSHITKKNGTGWIMISRHGECHEKTVDLARAFIRMRPERPELSQAVTYGVRAAAKTGDAAGAIALLDSFQPESESERLKYVEEGLQALDGTLVGSVKEAEGTRALKRLIGLLPSGSAVTDRSYQNFILLHGLCVLVDFLAFHGRTDQVQSIAARAKSDLSEPLYVQMVESRVKHRDMAGKPAPELKSLKALGDWKGGIKSYHGSLVLLQFFGHYCKPCIEEFPAIASLRRRLGPKGLAVVSVTDFSGQFKGKAMSQDEEYDAMKDYLAQLKVVWPCVFVDRDTFLTYGIVTIPHLVLIDQEGRVADSWTGLNMSRLDRIESKIQELLRRAATPSVTQPPLIVP